jgi:putative methyltransferase (TIGR04325 family)
MQPSDFIPPILYKLATRLSNRRTQNQPAKLFSSYAEAQNVCQRFGYENAALIDVVFQKTIRLMNRPDLTTQPLTDFLIQSLNALLIALYSSQRNELTVMDFGGACGAHYFLVRSLLPPGTILHWGVVETPAMVTKAKLLETDELSFYDSIADAKESLDQIDLLHSSGTIQYVPDPENSIEEMLKCDPHFLFLNRLALSRGEKIITIQESLLSSNGPGPMPEGMRDGSCRYPITYFPKTQLEEMLNRDYQIKISLGETTISLIDKQLLVNGGYLVERRK